MKNDCPTVAGRLAVEDRLAIADLFNAYTEALDTGDVEGVVACFTEDGWVDSPIVGRYEGRAGLREFAELTARAVRNGARFRHVVSNLRITGEGADGARAKCYLLDFATMDGRTELLSPGEYECEVARTLEGWRFRSRVVRMDRGFTIPGG